MKKLLLLLLCVPLIGLGQSWETTFGGTERDYANSVQQTADGGYIITGSTRSISTNGSADLYLIKTDGNGVEQWNQTFVGAYGYSVQQTTDGGYIITGGVAGDVYLVKTDANGGSLWTKTFGGTGYDIGYSVQQTTDGGYIIAGLTVPVSNGPNFTYLIKTDGSGNEQWNQISGNSGAWEVQQTSDGGYIIARGGSAKKHGSSGCAVKTDSNGNEEWSYLGNLAGFSVQQTTDGGYIMCGYTDSDDTLYSSYDVGLIKTDGNGNEQWNQKFGGIDLDWGTSVKQTTDGGYIITGVYAIGYGLSKDNDVYLIKTDGNGNEQWNQKFGGIDLDEGNDVQQTIDGGYIICGSTESFGNGNSDIYLIKTDGNGNVTSEFTIPINPNRKLEKVVDILGRDINPEKNKPFIEIYNDGTVEKKIIIE